MLLRKKEKIEAWLDRYNVKNYELIEDQEYGYVVNVNGNVDLNDKNLNSIDVKFNEVHGDFDCSENNFKNFTNFPKIIKGEFWCCDNQLIKKELKNLPIVTNSIYLYANEKLEEFQFINSYEEILNKINIENEKNKLMNIINKENLKKQKNSYKV